MTVGKLGALGFDKKSIDFISDYLRNRKQNTKIGSAFRGSLNILFSISQGSILGSFRFIIFITDLFYINDNLCQLPLMILTFADSILQKLLISEDLISSKHCLV